MPFTFSDFDQRAQKVLDHIRQDISTLRTGRAHTSMLDSVLVEAYGTKMKIQEVASVAAPDPSLIVVTPWDKSLIEHVAKGIMVASLGLNPVVDAEIIRISVPALSAERRQEMVKMLAQKIEAGKVMLRNLRGDIRKEIEDSSDEDGVSEDDIKAWQEELDKKVKDTETEIDQIKNLKEKELTTI